MSSHHTDTRRQGFALALICIAQFMVVLDFSIVNIALPFMQKDLGLSTANLQWIVSAYALTFGGFLLLGGRMGDLYGRRKLFMAGLFVFSLASLSGGLALSGTMLIVSRAIQGVGAAMVAPTAIALVSTTFPEGPARNKAFGMVGAISSLGFAAGAIFGGLLTAGPGWRWVMFVNVPIGLVTLVLIPRLLTESQNQNKQRRVDVLGAILVTAGLIALVYTLSQGNSSGWLSLQTIGLFVLSVVLLVAFVIVEQRSSSPLVRLGIFRLRNVTGANLINLITPGVMGSVIFVLTLFMQEVMGFNAIQMGAAFLPIALMILLISNISSRLIGRLGAKTLLVGGLGIAIVGLFLFLRISVHGSYVATMLPAFLVVGLGMGFAFPTIMITATAGVEDHEQGLAAGLFNTTQEAGPRPLCIVVKRQKQPSLVDFSPPLLSVPSLN